MLTTITHVPTNIEFCAPAPCLEIYRKDFSESPIEENTVDVFTERSKTKEGVGVGIYKTCSLNYQINATYFKQ